MNRTMNSILDDDQDTRCHRALIISNSYETIEFVERSLITLGYDTLVSRNGKWALNLLKSVQISYAVIDINLSDMPCHKLVHAIRAYPEDAEDNLNYIPVIILADTEREDELNACVAAGCDDFLFKPFTTVALKYRLALLDQTCNLKTLYNAAVNEQLLASRILNNALEVRSTSIDEIGVFAKSFSIFSGDLFLTERHKDGSLNILLADFTGHGLSAAIGALPVADVFSAMTKKGFDLNRIIQSLNNKLHTLLPAGMFMACCVLNISRTLQTIKIWNGGIPDVIVREHKSGRIIHNIGSSHIPLGICETSVNPYNLKIVDVDITPGDQLILYSDGLIDAHNAHGEMFGTKYFELCLKNPRNPESIFSSIVESFTEFCGSVMQMDDITLACIPCISTIMQTAEVPDITTHAGSDIFDADNWYWHLELEGTDLHETDPVPIVISQIQKASGHSTNLDSLSAVISSLYHNIAGYNASGAVNDSSVPDTISNYAQLTGENKNEYLRIGLKKVEHDGKPALLLRMEDSGKKSIPDQLTNNLNNDDFINAGLPKVYAYSSMSNIDGTGNKFETIIYKRITTGN